MQVEIIDDTPRAPLRFVRVRRSRHLNNQQQQLPPSQQSVRSITTPPRNSVTNVNQQLALQRQQQQQLALNAPLFKFQIAACYVIGHVSEVSGGG
jgi:hypothetical protein